MSRRSAKPLSALDASGAQAFYDALPAEAVADFARLKALVAKVAADTPGVGPLSETLKWGEPSYTPATPRIGSSVRFARHKRGVALNFICHTGLVDRFREIYPGLEYEGNRTIVVARDAEPDEAAISH